MWAKLWDSLEPTSPLSHQSHGVRINTGSFPMHIRVKNYIPSIILVRLPFLRFLTVPSSAPFLCLETIFFTTADWKNDFYACFLIDKPAWCIWFHKEKKRFLKLTSTWHIAWQLDNWILLYEIEWNINCENLPERSDVCLWDICCIMALHSRAKPKGSSCLLTSKKLLPFCFARRLDTRMEIK